MQIFLCLFALTDQYISDFWPDIVDVILNECFSYIAYCSHESLPKTIFFMKDQEQPNTHCHCNSVNKEQFCTKISSGVRDNQRLHSGVVSGAPFSIMLYIWAPTKFSPADM